MGGGYRQRANTVRPYVSYRLGNQATRATARVAPTFLPMSVRTETHNHPQAMRSIAGGVGEQAPPHKNALSFNNKLLSGADG